MAEVIRLDAIVKRFKTYESETGAAGALFGRKKKIKTAVNGVSFGVEKGEIIALLGRNGSGKSTVIKLLTGVLHPDSGKISVLGMDPWRDRIRLARRIGIVFGSTHPQLFWNLPPIDTFNYVRDMYGIPEAEFKERLDGLVETLTLKDVYKRQTRQLSLGERMKCEFVAANLHAPEVVFMDEPTIGVDLPSRMAIAEAVQSLRRERGITFLITTHVVDDVTGVDRIILLDHGKLVFDGTQERMRSQFRKSVILELYLKLGADRSAYAKLGRVMTSNDGYIKIGVKPSVVRQSWFVRMLSDRNIRDFRLSEPGLSSMLNQMYHRIDKRDKDGDGS